MKTHQSHSTALLIPDTDDPLVLEQHAWYKLNGTYIYRNAFGYEFIKLFLRATKRTAAFELKLVKSFGVSFQVTGSYSNRERLTHIKITTDRFWFAQDNVGENGNVKQNWLQF